MHSVFFYTETGNKFVQVCEAVLQSLRESHCGCHVIHSLSLTDIGTVMHGSEMQLLLNGYFSP